LACFEKESGDCTLRRKGTSRKEIGQNENPVFGRNYSRLRTS